MTIDYRGEVERYYDLHTDPYEDVSFYIRMMNNGTEHVLELGCGTGRVLVPLVEYCEYIHGIDISEAMLAICREKLQKENVTENRARVDAADITDFDLSRKFDLIIAPYRVFQNLETDDKVNGFFKCIRKHLAPDGRCILNVFKPLRSPDQMEKMWTSNDKEHLLSEHACDDGKVVVYEVRNKFRLDPLTIYPMQLIRRYHKEKLIEENQCEITMRCYYPDEFEKLITDHGFEVVSKWGGYDNKVYGRGNELVVEFKDGILKKNDLQGLKQ